MLKRLLLSAVCFSVFATDSSFGCQDTFSDGKIYIGASAGLGRFKGKCDRKDENFVTTDEDNGDDVHLPMPHWGGSGKKTATVFDVFVGGTCRLDALVLGVDVSFGKATGKVKYKCSGTCQTGASGGVGIYEHITTVPSFVIGEQWHVSLLPRIGVAVIPECVVYALAGLQTSALKVKTACDTDMPVCNSTFMCTKKTKRNALVWGGGIKVDLCDDLSAKMEYNCIPLKKVKTHSLTHRQVKNVRYGGHVVKLGLAYNL
ncbi:MAG: porin family protein [Alphaproteobacteria bacterium]|nr:porin family protein [Alphaproteobacteria bacterium]